MNIVEFIEDIIERRGAESYLGEVVTMREHFLQAAMLAEQDSAPDTVIAASLLHDIGHYTNEFDEDALAKGVNNWHDEAGHRVLTAHFPPAVCEPVRLHVNAKRYLCAIEPAYFDGLSPASVQSLEVQGGPFNEDEVKAFAKNEFVDDAVRVRRYDDGAKIKDLKTPGFDHYVPLLRRLVTSS